MQNCLIITQYLKACQPFSTIYLQKEKHKTVFMKNSLRQQEKLTVGSSNSNKSGSINNALASAILMRQPPENVFVERFCMSDEKLRPLKIKNG
jgi:hypothetical protein